MCMDNLSKSSVLVILVVVKYPRQKCKVEKGLLLGQTEFWRMEVQAAC